MTDGPLAIVVVGDDHAHRVLIQQLVDAVLEEYGRGAGWPDADQLDQARRWFGRADAPNLTGWADGFYSAKNARRDLGALPMPSGRRFFNRRVDGRAVADDPTFDDVIQLMNLLPSRPQVLAMVRDVDRVEARQVLPRREAADAVVEVLGLARPEAEAWVLVALAEPEAEVVDRLRRELGFDPTLEPERCSSARALPSGRAPKDAKRVLRVLTGHADELASAEPRALNPDALGALLSGLVDRLERARSRGQGCGLDAFIGGLRGRLLPQVLRSSPPPAQPTAQ